MHALIQVEYRHMNELKPKAEIARNNEPSNAQYLQGMFLLRENPQIITMKIVSSAHGSNSHGAAAER